MKQCCVKHIHNFTHTHKTKYLFVLYCNAFFILVNKAHLCYYKTSQIYLIFGIDPSHRIELNLKQISCLSIVSYYHVMKYLEQLFNVHYVTTPLQEQFTGIANTLFCCYNSVILVNINTDH